MSLELLQSRIPVIISKQGYSIAKLPQKQVVYDGRHISTFLWANKTDYSDTGVKRFLSNNKIGSPFDIPVGINVKILPSADSFSVYPE
jgi:hypothetical protein